MAALVKPPRGRAGRPSKSFTVEQAKALLVAADGTRWHGGDTRTGKSRRTLALPRRCVDALRAHHRLQAKDRLRAGQLWQDHGLVFASTVGTPLSASNVIRAFQGLTEKAGLGTAWAPREMRHTFVSVLSANEVRLESIALLAGQDRTSTTELVYRHELRPALTQGAEVMDKIFGLSSWGQVE